VPKRRSYDRLLLLTATMLAFAGLFMVGSASHYIAMSLGKDPTYFLVRHGAFLALGLVTMAGAIALPLYSLDESRVVGCCSPPSLALLLVVLACRPPEARTAGSGWGRWDSSRRSSQRSRPSCSLPTCCPEVRRRSQQPALDARPGGGVDRRDGFLIVIEPDLGSAVMVLAAAAVMLFVAGALRYLGAAMGCTACCSSRSPFSAHPYRIGRIGPSWTPGATRGVRDSSWRSRGWLWEAVV
jgi:cell division protein FtsW